MSDDVEFAEKISEQVAKIDSIVNDLDHRWMESEKVLEFLRKHHNFNTASITDGESK
jgi:hypothetical protein